MKLIVSRLILLLTSRTSLAWVTTYPTHFSRTRSTCCSSTLASHFRDLSEFDYLLSEGGSQQQQQQQQQQRQQSSPSFSRRRIQLPLSNDSIHNQRTTILASSFAAPTTEETTTTAAAERGEAGLTDGAADTAAAEDPYASAFDSQLGKIQTFEEQKQTRPSMEQRLKSMDLQDIVVTLILPSIALFASGRWVYNRVASRVMERGDETLNSFAREMLYHDGDFDEMKLCYQDYTRKLVWMGPNKKPAMLKRYLESYAKKKTVSPAAISSLSYVFTLAGLTEEKAAAILVSCCRQMGDAKIASTGKLLFLGSRILKSPQGKEALEPIKNMIKATYRDATVAETLVETSQRAIAEASYRSTVLAGGKNQKSLTIGWETLGLDRETAQSIWDEEAKEGFLSDREAMYGGQTQKYDKKGRRLNKDGKPEDFPKGEGDDQGSSTDEADDNSSAGPVSNVYECSQCGFTMFIAQGRESKFFGNDFKCPECGAPKEKFEKRDDFGED